MKKTLAMLLAAATTMSAGVMALAEEGNVRDMLDASMTEALEENASSSEGGASEGEQPENSQPENSQPGAGEQAADPSAFVFGADSDNEGAVLGTTILEPGKEYKFPVSLTIGSETKPMTEEMVKDYKFTYSKLSSNSVKTFEIKEYKGAYYLYVEARESTPTKPIDVKYNLKLVRKSNNLSVFAQEVKFQYGYDEHNSDYINGLGKGDTVEIDNNSPVITASQFDKIAKINDYKNVTLSGPSWSFTVNVTDESTKNMVSNNAGIKEILSKLPDQEFKFYNFAGKPTFNSTGRLALDVDDIIDDYANLYVYRYNGGKLYKMNATLNKDDNTLEFRTNTLDNYVVTDKSIKDGFKVTDEVLGGTTGGNDSNSGSNSGSSSDSGKDVPSTGASDLNLAVAAALASLAAAGFAAFKKSSK